MTELVADRIPILRSKRHESSNIVKSRKRKLRELFTVATGAPVRQLPHANLDSSASTQTEARFLEENDILQHRTLNESSIPTRRQLRSDTAKTPSSSATPIDSSSPAPSRSSNKGQRDDGEGRSRGGSPLADLSNGSIVHNDKAENSRSGRSLEVPRDEVPSRSRRASSTRSCKEVTPQDELIIDAVIDQTIDDAVANRKVVDIDEEPPTGSSEEERIINDVESRPGSPGIDPKKALPPSAAEDSGQLPYAVINGLDDPNHHALTAHLPPRAVQEEQLRINEKHRKDQAAQDANEGRAKNLSIKLPHPHNPRSIDQMSSPGSTIDAHSATTPGLHEASTDTSPEHEDSRYNTVETSDEKEDKGPDTPIELAPSNEEVQEKEEHDRLLQAQMNLVRNEILSSPTTADAQLRFEEQAAAAVAENVQNSSDSNMDEASSSVLTHTAAEVVEDVVDDEDEVVGIPTPVDDEVSGPNSVSVDKVEARHEQPMVLGDPMDVDEPSTVQQTATPAATSQIHEASPREQPSSPAASRSAGPSDQPTPAPTPPAAERMTTRVSSGAMRQKSVSEILGETPRLVSSSSPKAPAEVESLHTVTPLRSQALQNVGQSVLERIKEKKKSNLSTVVFAKSSTKSSKAASNSAMVGAGAKTEDAEETDYFMPLIVSQAYNSARGTSQPLDSLLQTAHKTITTSNAYVPFHDQQMVKILSKVVSLQRQGKWSFRQPKRAPEPFRPTTHWDEMMKEMKWMRTDFREEGKWKRAAARNLAHACAEWVSVDAEDRKLLQINAVSPPVIDKAEFIIENNNAATPELVFSGEHDSPAEDFDEEPSVSHLDVVAPSAIFSLSDEDVTFALRRTAATDGLLAELPMYGVPLKVPQSDLPTSEVDPDASWRRQTLPLSKFADSKIVLKNPGPPKKRSRYDYSDESEDEEDVVFGGHKSKRPHLEPVLKNVALFNPENKATRDRLHASHQFRPPSEHVMPLQSFYESRTPSHWTWAEDDELKNNVREYCYNWQLISSISSSKSLFPAGYERRTPWECFERWIQLEGLPSDMARTQYFRAYNHRLETAYKNLQAQAAAAPPQMGNGSQAVATPVRRRTTASVRVERKRNQKHLSQVDAMRKLAKKRETNVQKQQHAANLAATRKANEAPQAPGPGRLSPQEFSRLKHEKDMHMRERMERMQQEQVARHRLLQQAKLQQQNPQHPNGTNGALQQPRNPSQGSAPGVAPLSQGPRPNQLAVPGQNMPHPPMQPPLPNGMAAQSSMGNGQTMPPIPMKGIPQAQMQNMQGIQGQHRQPVPNPTPDLRLVMQAQQISEQQRQAVQMQQQGRQHPGQNSQIHNSPPNMRANMSSANQSSLLQNQALMAAFNSNNSNGSTSPANNYALTNGGSSGSPRMNAQQVNGQSLNQSHPNGGNHSGGLSHIAKLEAQARAQFPTASPEHIRKLVTDNLQAMASRQQVSQAAMHAAAGGSHPSPSPAHVPGGHPGPSLVGLQPGMQNSPQQYAQMLRAQQQQQAANAAANLSAKGANNVNSSSNSNGVPAQGNTNGNVNGNVNGNAGLAGSQHSRSASVSSGQGK